MSQRDCSSVSDVLVQEVRNEGEDLRRDAVDWCEVVPPGSAQAEGLESVLLKSANLKDGTRERTLGCPVGLSVSPQLRRG